MQAGLGFLDLIFVLAVVVFVVTRFLGNNLPKEDKKQRNQKKNPTIISFPEKKKSAQTAPVVTVKAEAVDLESLSGIEKIKAVDKSFKEKSFLEGAKQGYFMVYDALMEGDEDTLDDLTSPRIFDRLMDMKETQEEKNGSWKLVVDDVLSAEIIDTKVHGQTAIISVKYKTKQTETLSDKSETQKLDVIWTWARNLNSTDPNWELEDMAKLD